jgi:hypothetical protein
MNKNKRLIKFPSIEQFRTVVSNVNRHFNFVGLDENGEAIYDPTLPKPTITFKGAVKLHGTNAGVSFNALSGMWAQSRENIITPEKDNAGFAFFVHSNFKNFDNLFYQIIMRNSLDISDKTITIYGEWCGGNIQKGVGVSNLPKSFFIFGVKITPHTETEEELKANPAYWVDYSYLRAPEQNIYNIDDYPTYSIDIDFNMPQLVQNQLSELTIAVEEECPVAKAFGFSGIGEGIVWTAKFKGVVHRFKVKGELHAGKSKVKTLNKVDDEKVRKTLELAEKVTPTWRLAQMLETSCDFMNGGTLDRSKLGEFIKLVMADIIKEDMDLLVEAGLEPKDIGKYVSDIARRYFFDQELI